MFIPQLSCRTKDIQVSLTPELGITLMTNMLQQMSDRQAAFTASLPEHFLEFSSETGLRPKVADEVKPLQRPSNRKERCECSTSHSSCPKYKTP